MKNMLGGINKTPNCQRKDEQTWRLHDSNYPEWNTNGKHVNKLGDNSKHPNVFVTQRGIKKNLKIKCQEIFPNLMKTINPQIQEQDIRKNKDTKAWHKKNLFKTNDKDKNLKSNKEDSLSTEE